MINTHYRINTRRQTVNCIPSRSDDELWLTNTLSPSLSDPTSTLIRLIDKISIDKTMSMAVIKATLNPLSSMRPTRLELHKSLEFLGLLFTLSPSSTIRLECESEWWGHSKSSHSSRRWGSRAVQEISDADKIHPNQLCKSDVITTADERTTHKNRSFIFKRASGPRELQEP